MPLRAIPRLLRDSAIISAVVLSITAAAGLFGRIILSLQVLAVMSDFVDGPLTARGCSSSLSTCCF
ncbi:hypothetical protein [Salipiger aestuarii]|uniref:hypothetical protein n=1 Tax=Salipiger aestuarii TaxID=568098 RepID=UPI00123A8D0D|nr:hypothetical protein [Salipiger aestuarii]KAA8607185.1 hypothetical protein AL037_19220 [Salipiger aestuarii]